jgi:lipopolysaccharide biosynthesis regulator YciM
LILNNALLLVLLALAIAAGWTLGRGGLRIDGADRAQLPSQYYRGFNFLLDGEEDDAVDAFTEALAVNEDTLDTHIALGSVLRKRGEVDRAIRIHQNLLKRPQLTAVQLHQSHLELARDFIAAGLYDRAEQLLSDLAVQSTEFSATAQRHLLDVHEAQRDWVAATTIADQLIAQAEEGGQSATGQGQPVQQLRGHYLCEQADAALEAGDDTTAGEFYEVALRDQNQDLRARMGLAMLCLSAGDPEAALAHFRVIMGSGRNCTPELLALRCTGWRVAVSRGVGGVLRSAILLLVGAGTRRRAGKAAGSRGRRGLPSQDIDDSPVCLRCRIIGISGAAVRCLVARARGV